MKWKRPLLALLSTCLPLTGYAQNTSAGKKIDLKVITGHYHAGHRIMTRIANEKGWFREEGLGRVEITPLGTNDDHLTLDELAKGRADIVWDSHSDIVVQEDAKGAALAVIDVFRSFQPRNVIFAMKGLNSIHDLKGKRVGVNELDGMDAWEIRRGLELAGMNPDRDVVWVPRMTGQYAPGPPLQVLQRGDVQALTASGSAAEEIKRAGYPVVADLTKVYPLGYPIRFLVARRALAEQQPEAVEAFLRAITRAKRFAADPRNKAEVLALTRKLLEEDIPLGGARAEAARGELRTISAGSGNANRNDYYDAKGVEFLIEEQKKLGRVNASYRGDRLIHVDLLQRALAQLGQAVPVPKASGPIPVTAASHPFMSASVNQPPIDLAAHGYVEEEFFVSGLGNVYDWETDGTIHARSSALPYTTRILVRRPSSPERFSGTVLVDMGNRAQTFDTFATWGQLQDHLLTNGHIWVGASVFPVNIASMKKLDPARYAPLSFPKPAESCQSGNGRPPQFEDGIRWDVMSQIAALLKSDSASNPLAAYKVQYVYASMQSGGDLPTYVSAISRNVKLENGKPVYDAFLIKDSGGPGPLNSCSPRLSPGDPRLIMRNAGVPVIQILAQNAVSPNTRRPDSDAAGDQFRRYELPGASHFDAWHFMYRPPMSEINAMGIQTRDYLSVPNECEPREHINDFPQPYFFAAAFYNLDQWVRKGIAPPKAEFIELKESRNRRTPEFETDEFGNARGGIRSPWVDVPSGTFYPEMKGPGTCSDMGYWIPFTWQRLEAVYGSYENYRKKFIAAVDLLVHNRWVLPADGDKIKKQAGEE